MVPDECIDVKGRGDDTEPKDAGVVIGLDINDPCLGDQADSDFCSDIKRPKGDDTPINMMEPDLVGAHPEADGGDPRRHPANNAASDPAPTPSANPLLDPSLGRNGQGAQQPVQGSQERFVSGDLGMIISGPPETPNNDVRDLLSDQAGPSAKEGGVNNLLSNQSEQQPDTPALQQQGQLPDGLIVPGIVPIIPGGSAGVVTTGPVLTPGSSSQTNLLNPGGSGIVQSDPWMELLVRDNPETTTPPGFEGLPAKIPVCSAACPGGWTIRARRAT
jgi:hypothetical protein